ncbi:Plant self-incompatibility protein S1 family [Arabidopsis thaliana]|uniref:S-protein homolog n=1 Tax=Arabidopsis thaliana TaxID=3702 RepID=Q9ZQ02_ARATH|nr:Plant self-incompatibility protein S1 family [Arabidopsis thaliana]AAD19763.1 putative S1 self-incompatibility protein [Arabidopsis thaliana]AEC06001.1 Plant self-incompatibility protein S1 family [Arabidopsis thaliana]|eukprot:NP_178663.1 Plant self-incompatibility protein S1 family [Arabidopsis thaliana]
MNNLFVLLIIIALSVGSNNGSKLWPKNQLHFRNSFSRNYDVLTVHCKSKDDDLGIHTVARSYEYNFKFEDSVFGRTEFFCTLMHGVGSKYSVTFTAYKAKPAFVASTGVIKIWDALDDGIYLTDEDHDFVKIYGW